MDDISPQPHVARLFSHPLDAQNIDTVANIFINEMPNATSQVLESDPSFDRISELAEVYGEALVRKLLNILSQSAIAIAQALQGEQ